ncbi:unnamed protein product [Linum tenue]|uniref:Uncharacterized protein n=1 Tax=Linum tenue TaxID=586396 RepID=A0AAV0MYI3_9ROSI|nr:unnamed protein product [Linum tenue]
MYFLLSILIVKRAKIKLRTHPSVFFSPNSIRFGCHFDSTSSISRRHGSSSSITEQSRRREAEAMAGLLAWAADVVGGHGSVHGDEADDIPILFTEEQQSYVRELDRKSASLTRAIQDLRQRLPPADISQRLPHLLAHSLASNAALTMQLNAHSATKEQTQLREVTLQEENAAYERAISNCESKIQEKVQETDLLQRKLKEIDDVEINLREQMENVEAAKVSESAKSSDLVVLRKEVREGSDAEAAKVSVLEKLEAKKKELSSMEEIVQELERKWAHTQEKALKQPTPGLHFHNPAKVIEGR